MIYFFIGNPGNFGLGIFVYLNFKNKQLKIKTTLDNNNNIEIKNNKFLIIDDYSSD